MSESKETQTQAKKQDVCIQNVLSVFQFEILMKNKSFSRKHSNQIMEGYKTLRKMYLDLCNKCQITEYGSFEEESKLVDYLFEFSLKLRDVQPLVGRSCELKNALTLMFCHQQKCTRLGVGTELNRNFLNWVSHRVSFIGNDALGIDNTVCVSLGDGDPEKMWENISNCVNESMENMNGSIEDKIKRAKFAMRCYITDFYIRHARFPQEDCILDSICGESCNNEHRFRRELAEQLTSVLEKYINDNEVSVV